MIILSFVFLDWRRTGHHRGKEKYIYMKQCTIQIQYLGLNTKVNESEIVFKSFQLEEAV